jgi:peroxiredoxin
MQFLAPGKVAPDFAQPKSDGKMLKLSDMKGKVVLIDS